MELPYQQRRPLLLLGFAVEGGMAVLAWVLGRLLHVPIEERWLWSLPDAGWAVLACLPLLAVFLLCLYWPIPPLRAMERFFEEVLRPLFAPLGILDLALISLLAGVGEEMLFRGVFQDVLSRWFGSVAGWLLASLLFGALHPMTPAYAVIAFLMGLYLGCVYWATDNLLVVALAHGLYDFVALVFLLKLRKPAALSPGTDHPDGW